MKNLTYSQLIDLFRNECPEFNHVDSMGISIITHQPDPTIVLRTTSDYVVFENAMGGVYIVPRDGQIKIVPSNSTSAQNPSINSEFIFN